MRNILRMLLLTMVLSSCSTKSPEPEPAAATLTAYVHWGNYGIAEIQINLLHTNKTAYTDSMGKAVFTASPGADTLRAYGISLGGASFEYTDFPVNAEAGQKTTVDIVDCISCTAAGK